MAVLHLSAADIARLNAAQQALLAPLESEESLEWQLRANHAVRAFIGAEHSLFGVGAEEAGPAIVTDDTDPNFPNRLHAYYVGLDEGDFRFRDPVMEKMGRVRRAGGTGAYHMHMLATPAEIRRSPGHQEVFNPAGLTHLVGLSTPLPVGEVTQFFSFTGSNVDARQARGFARLQLLVPAFEAGVRIQRQLSAWRTTLAAMLDRLSEALAIYSTRGALLHRNSALGTLLAADPEAERLHEAAEGVARALTVRWKTRRQTIDPAQQQQTAYVRTAATEYRVLGSYLPGELFGAEGVLVQVERLQPPLPSPETLRSRFGLTERESEVALLLAEGLPDRAIADRLNVSSHTARRYSERVLQKLRVHSRAAVALTLLR